MPDDPFSTEWTREALRAVYAQGVNHIAQVGLSHIPPLWYLVKSVRATCCGTRSATGSWKIFQLCCQMRGGRFVRGFPPLKVKNCFGRSAAIVEVEDMYLDRLKQCHSSEFLSRA
jgi:hypothetical protein